ncbi:TPA: hypothetical protein HA241_04775 [Candidatus Woesearchaeota archaeon]|nr:hypothetical protein [Candidatus Woesearchaeota archaeon]
MSASINRIWRSLTPDERKKIEAKLGIDLDSFTTSSDRVAVLAQYYEQIGGCPPPVLSTRYHSSLYELGSGSLSPPRMIVSEQGLEHVVSENVGCIPGLRASPSEGTITLSRETDYGSLSSSVGYKSASTIRLFLRKGAEYVAIVVLTLAGAYGGFSATRYTHLADELRRMEKNPIVKAYQFKHGIESFQKLREWDILSPDREEIAKDRRYIDTAKSVTEGATDLGKWLVSKIPFVGDSIEAGIEHQESLVDDYIQKKRMYSSKMMWYTLTGAGSGLAAGVLLSLKKRRRQEL